MAAVINPSNIDVSTVSTETKDAKETVELFATETEIKPTLLSEIPGLRENFPAHAYYDLSCGINDPVIVVSTGKSVDGATLLELAINNFYKNPQLALLLLAYGADPNRSSRSSDNISLLMIACRGPSSEIVNSLIQQGADYTRKDKDGFTAIDWIITNDDPGFMCRSYEYEIESNLKYDLNLDFLDISKDALDLHGLNRAKTCQALLSRIYEVEFLQKTAPGLRTSLKSFIPLTGIQHIIAEFCCDAMNFQNISKRLIEIENPHALQMRFSSLARDAYFREREHNKDKATDTLHTAMFSSRGKAAKTHTVALSASTSFGPHNSSSHSSSSSSVSSTVASIPEILNLTNAQIKKIFNEQEDSAIENILSLAGITVQRTDTTTCVSMARNWLLRSPISKVTLQASEVLPKELRDAIKETSTVKMTID